MDQSAIQKSILDLLVVLNAAITNIRLYPSTSSLIVNSVERLHNAIQSILPQVDHIEFAESEKSMLIQGEPLLEKDRKRPQVGSFLATMLDLGIRRVAILPGITLDEVGRFLQVMGNTPEEIHKNGGLHQLFKDRNIIHVTIDAKFYITVDPGKGPAAGTDVSAVPAGEQSVPKEALPSENQAMDPAEAQKQKIEGLKRALSSILKGEVLRLPEISSMPGLVEVIEKLAETGKHFTVAAILDRLGEGALHANGKTRIAAAALLSKIDEQFEKSGFLDFRLRLSQKLAAWVGFEPGMTPAHQAVVDRLQHLSQVLEEAGRIGEAGHVLEIFNQIYSGDLPKEDAVKQLAKRFLSHLATDEAVDSLLKEPVTDADRLESGEDTASSLLLGAATIERLLDRLHDSHNRSERNRVVQVITKIGAPALPPILERLKQGGPWYYLRNLVLLLGRIGTETHLPVLESMLMHEDARVQREAVYAIQNIGGGEIGSLLLRNLYTVEDEARMLMISVLGLMKYPEAVPDLVEILQSRTPGKTKKTRNELLVKVCEALGRIGNTLAIPALEKIRQSKGLLSLMGHDPEVRDAAEEALALIKKRNAS